MTAAEQAAAKGGQVVQVPVDLGAEGVVYNLPLPAGSRLHLTGPVIARIFLGQITSWHDPAITALNPGINLPDARDLRRAPLRRQRHDLHLQQLPLQRVPAWAAKVGAGKTLHWPVGEGAEGNGGVAASVYRTPFSIGYVEQSYSKGLLLPSAAIRNQAGHYVIPSIQSAAADAAQKPAITPDRLLDRQPARLQQLPHHRIQLGTRLRPPAQPGHRAATRQPPGLAHPQRSDLRRRHQLRTPPNQNPATRPHHAPAGHRPRRNTPAGLNAAGKPGPPGVGANWEEFGRSHLARPCRKHSTEMKRSFCTGAQAWVRATSQH